MDATLRSTLDSLNFEALVAYYDLSSDMVRALMDSEEFTSSCASKFSIETQVQDFEQLIAEYFRLQGDQG